ncbi:hypothetical protein CsatB_001111 [Cannabis sativa]
MAKYFTKKDLYGALALDPLIGAISAGNAVVLKPSNHALACSSVLANLIPLYMDSKAIQVIEGGPQICEKFLLHKWDKIFFTGCSEKNSWSNVGACSGQACIAVDYLLVEANFAPTVIEMLKKTIKRFYGEKPIESKSIARIVNQRHFERLTGFLKDPLVPVTMQAQKEAPADMQCKDKFLLQSVKVNDGVAGKDINAEMFNKEEGHIVEECKKLLPFLLV